jgi:hypothetical protein
VAILEFGLGPAGADGEIQFNDNGQFGATSDLRWDGVDLLVNGVPVGSGGSGGAPTNATYLLQVPDGDLPGAQALSLLGTGLLKNTTTTGVLSIAVAADIPDLSVTYLTLSAAAATYQPIGSYLVAADLSPYLTSATAASTYQPIGSYLTSVTAHNVLSTTHGDTLAASVVRGDLFIGNATPKWARLAVGAANAVLSSDGTDVAWQASTGTGSNVRATSPALVTPDIGVATATTLNKLAITAPATSATLVIADGKTFTVNQTLTLTGTTGTTMTFPATSATLARTDAAQTFTGSQTITANAIGAVSTDGLVLTNTTAAAAGAQQWSPRLHFTAAGWKSTATAASQVVDFIAEIQPVQQTTATQNRLVFSAQTAAAGYTPVLNIVVDGVNAPGASDQLWVWESSGNQRGVWVGQSGILIAGVNPGTGLTPTTDGGNALSAVGLRLRGDTGLVQWASGTDPLGATMDVVLRRDAADTLAQRRTTTAQKFRLYNTFTTVDTAGEWFKLDWKTTANQFRFGTVKGSSTGTAEVASWDYGGTEASPVAAITVPATSGPITIAGGLAADSGGVKHSRVTTGSVSAASTALVTVTWSTAFPDANYTVEASVVDSTTTSLSLSVVHVESITASAVTVRVINNAAGSLTGTLHVVAVHD